jgi:tRNA-modifying protein YgfZ
MESITSATSTGFSMSGFASPDHVIVTFSGVDSQSFLQSQLTNDVAALAVGAWQWQGYCSAKGRLHATFALIRTADEQYAAVVHQSVAPFVTKRLMMFRLRAKVVIEQSVALSAVLHLETPALAAIDLGHSRWISLQDTASAEAATPELMRRWNDIGINALQPEITTATNEMFVPQMIAWDSVAPRGGVSFSKGCFPGQEVVARAHYRGAVKRHLERATLQSAEPLVAGQAVTLADGREAEICNVVQRADGSCNALVVVAAL